MFSYSFNSLVSSPNKIESPKIQRKKIKLQKIFLSQPSIKSPIKKKLQIIHGSFTPREKIEKIKLKKFSPLKNPKYKKAENYLISKSLISRYDNLNTFDFSYYKQIPNKYSPILGKKEIYSKELTDNTKKTFKKNIIIDILKKKRQEISKNERLIEYSFKEFKRKIDEDFINFNRIKNEYRVLKRKELQILGYYELVNQKIRRDFILERMRNKRLRDTIEKVIRDIYKLKEYATFIHSMYGRPFPMEQIDENLLYDNKFDILREELIKLYNDEELEKENEKKIKLLTDINLFMKNFIFYENNIIHLLKENNAIIKETQFIKLNNKNRLQHLVRRKNDYLDVKYSYKKIEKNFQNELSSIAVLSKNGLYDQTINYILQFIKIFNIQILLNKNKDTEIDYYKYCKEIEKVLRQKENIIDIFTKEIDEILNSGNEKDKNLMEKIIFERKRYNLKKLQFFTKENLVKKEELSKIKIIDKNKKKVVKGRMLLDYKFISLHKDDNKKNDELIKKIMAKNNDINIEYCFSEYNNKI